MPLSKSLSQPIRQNMLNLGAGWRGFFAPFNNTLAYSQNSLGIGPTVIDLSAQGPLNTNSLPSGWFDLGWIRDFKRNPGSKIGQIRSGKNGLVKRQLRGQVDETFECKFREMSRMAFKVSSGCLPFNLLAGGATSSVGPLAGSGAAISKVALHASGYKAAGLGSEAGNPCVCVPAGSGWVFANSYIVVDNDYDGTTAGLVGDAGVPVLYSGQVTDADYLRKTSDYVARVKRVTTTVVAGVDALVLATPLAGGGYGDPTGAVAPTSAAKVQKVVGFAVREGGTFITEWSAIFVVDTIDGGQVAVYYPHVSINQARGFGDYQIENIGTTDMMGRELDGVFTAMGYEDPIDGEPVVSYTAYYPGSKQDFNI